MTDTHYLSSTKLLESMRGRQCTGGWDILVSYKAVQLSNLLAEVWKKNKGTKKLVFEDSAIRFGRKCSYELELGSPKLAFEPSDGGCTASLTIPLAGIVSVQLYMEKDDSTYPEKPYKTRNQNITKDTHNLKISVPVKSVTGDVKVENIDRQAELAQHVITLGEGEKAKAHIILHFSSEKAIYNVESISASNSVTPTATGQQATSSNATGSTIPPATTASSTGNIIDLLSETTKDIQKWFSSKDNVNAIDYRLATVKALEDPSDSSAVLKPKSFVFGSNGDVLCIYVQTEGSGAQPGDTEAKFTNSDSSTIRPIPEGSTASIIVAHRLLHEKVFLSQLRKYQSDNGISSDKAVQTFDNVNGFTYKFYVKGDFEVNMKGEHGVLAQVSIPQKTVHMDDAMTTLKIEDTKATFDYSKTYPIKWSSSSFGTRQPTEYTANLTVKISQTSDAVTVSENKNIATDLSITKESFKLEKESTSGDVKLYEGVNNAKIDFKNVSLRSPNLNFIAAESILAPGATIVNVESIHIPYDMILVGNMVSHITA